MLRRGQRAEPGIALQRTRRGSGYPGGSILYPLKCRVSAFQGWSYAGVIRIVEAICRYVSCIRRSSEHASLGHVGRQLRHRFSAFGNRDRLAVELQFRRSSRVQFALNSAMPTILPMGKTKAPVMWSLHIVTSAAISNRRRTGQHEWHLSELSGYLILPAGEAGGEGDHPKDGGGVVGAGRRNNARNPLSLPPSTPPPGFAGAPSPIFDGEN